MMAFNSTDLNTNSVLLSDYIYLHLQVLKRSKSVYCECFFWCQLLCPLFKAPVSGPENITFTNVTLDSAVLQWSLIPEEDLRGFLLGYTICYAEYNYKETMTTENSNFFKFFDIFFLLLPDATRPVALNGRTEARMCPPKHISPDARKIIKPILFILQKKIYIIFVLYARRLRASQMAKCVTACFSVLSTHV